MSVIVCKFTKLPIAGYNTRVFAFQNTCFFYSTRRPEASDGGRRFMNGAAGSECVGTDNLRGRGGGVSSFQSVGDPTLSIL